MSEDSIVNLKTLTGRPYQVGSILQSSKPKRRRFRATFRWPGYKLKEIAEYEFPPPSVTFASPQELMEHLKRKVVIEATLKLSKYVFVDEIPVNEIEVDASILPSKVSPEVSPTVKKEPTKSIIVPPIPPVPLLPIQVRVTDDEGNLLHDPDAYASEYLEPQFRPHQKRVPPSTLVKGTIDDLKGKKVQDYVEPPPDYWEKRDEDRESVG